MLYRNMVPKCCYVMNFRVRLVVALVLVGGLLHYVISNCSNPAAIFAFSADYEDPGEVAPAVIEKGIFGNTLAPQRYGNSSLVVGGNGTIVGSATSNATGVYVDSGPNRTDYLMSLQPDSLETCPVHPPGLVGPIRVFMDEPQLSQMESLYSYLEAGGHGRPEKCKARHRVAVIVPYRDRMAHLKVLLHNLHSFLTKQQLDYAIFVVEPVANETFNRAKLMNVGYAEALKLYPWDCFIFHDVDLLPEDDRNLYSCPQQPRHMSVAIDKFNYALPYGSIFGGISALSRDHMTKLNGFSNDYWGWGGEDDDMSNRVVYAGFKISRYPKAIARYKMIKHKHEEKSNPVNKCRHKLLKVTKKRWKHDGLSNLKYTPVNVTRFPLYTHVVADLDEKASRAWLGKDGFPGC